MELGLEGRGCLVTGGTAGIGLATAQELARAGARVAIVGRDAERAAAVAAELEQLGAQDALGLGADLATREGAEHAVAAASARFGGLDVLVNNVGAARTSTWWELDDEAWLQSFELNVMSFVRSIRAVLPGMRERGRGAIVNVSSTSGKRPSTSMPNYSVTKAAVLSLSRLVADLYAKDGIRSNAIAPGPTATEAWLAPGGLADQQAERIGKSRDEALEAVAKGRPLGRLAEPDEIAAVIVFLCSDRANYVTGSAWSADGGTVPIII